MSNLRKLIERSRLFDGNFYSRTYADVRAKTNDPLAHYISRGAAEGRRPNRLFDGRFYAKEARIDLHRVNPLEHYISSGEAAGFRPCEHFDPKAYPQTRSGTSSRTQTLLAHHLSRMSANQRDFDAQRVTQPHNLRDIEVTIIVPVYNAAQELRRCIESVLVHTRLPKACLLLIDDASPDPAITPLLDTYANLSGVSVVKNKSNLGFTRTINRGIELAAKSDLVFLNSDTIVGPAWLEELMLAAYADPNVATATPLSDSAGAFSIPDPGANSTHEGVSVETAARQSRRLATASTMRVPTGNGFCLYVRRDALREVGPLDASAFPRGYGEENDWCQRASELGWTHNVALRSYVAHVNSASFGEGKTERIAEARKVLDERFPNYTAQLKATFHSGSLISSHRINFKKAIDQHTGEEKQKTLPRVLYVTATSTGGTPQTNADLMRGVREFYSPLLLTCDSRQLRLLEATSGSLLELECHQLSERVDFSTHRSAEYERVVANWLVRHGIELLHIRHIGWHSLGLPRTAQRLGIPVIYSFHDFYSVCPSVNLVADHEQWHPFGISEPQIAAPLWTSRDPVSLKQVRDADPRAFLNSWKRRMNAMLEHCAAMVTTHESVREILADNLPAVRTRPNDLTIIPHGRDFLQFLTPPVHPRSDEKLRLLVAGNITESKGLMTLLRILELDEDERIEVHVMGKCADQLQTSPDVHLHGEYDRDDFQTLVQAIRPHVSLVLSIWPETFCHTLTESWAAGLPVVGSALGAVGGRILASGAGWTVDPHDDSGIYALLVRIADGREEYEKRCQAVTLWQEGPGTERTVAAMTKDYLAVYRGVLNSSRTFGSARPFRARKRVALVAQEHFPRAPATAHVRIATRLRASQAHIDYDWIDLDELVRLGLSDFDGVIVCRNAGPAKHLEELASLCRSEEIPLVLDLDDDLLAVPEDKDSKGLYRDTATGIQALIKQARLVTLSTPELVETYRSHAKAVKLVENRLDRKMWFDEVPHSIEAPEGWVQEARLRVLYIGSYTHGQDLDLVLPVFEQLEASGVALHIVGIKKGVRPGYHRIKIPEDRYDRFVEWLRSIAPHFDVAIAPLVDNEFNRRKSALKFLEYSALGLPVVASDTGAYADTIRHGVDGLLAQGHESWKTHLTDLLDPHRRASLVAAARKRVERDFVCTESVFDEVDWGSAKDRKRDL